jgi:hypothetical protein
MKLREFKEKYGATPNATKSANKPTPLIPMPRIIFLFRSFLFSNPLYRRASNFDGRRCKDRLV